MDTPKIIIKTDGMKAEVTIDGKKIRGVRGYKLVHDAPGFPQLQLSLKATDVTVETDVIPMLPAPYDSFYVPKN
nr:MAG TPA: hypothetical protein [Caudoviricetes sp.]